MRNAAVGLFAVALLALPLAASADTTSVAQSQLIALLQQLVSTLEKELAQLQANANTQPAQTLAPVNIPAMPAATPTPTNAAPASTAPTPNCTLTANPASVTVGQNVTLSWSAQNSNGGYVTQIGPVLSSGSQTMTPAQTIDYSGSFTGAGGSAYCAVLVTVVPAATPPTTPTPAPAPTPTTSSTGGSCVAYQTTYPNGSTIQYLGEPGPGIPEIMGLTDTSWTCENGQWVSGAQTQTTSGWSCTDGNGDTVPSGQEGIISGCPGMDNGPLCAEKNALCQNGQWVPATQGQTTQTNSGTGGSCLVSTGASYPDGSTVGFNPCPNTACGVMTDIYLTCHTGQWFNNNGTPYSSINGQLPTP